MRDSFANRVRTILRNRQGGDVTVAEIARPLDCVFKADKLPIYQALRDMRKSGEVAGVYRWVGRGDQKPQLQQVMWRVLRARRMVTVEDLQELSGAGAEYANVWLRMLVAREVVRKNTNGTYQLVRDVVAMPVNEKNIQKQRRLRRQQREVLAALAAVMMAAERARMVIEEMAPGKEADDDA